MEDTKLLVLLITRSLTEKTVVLANLSATFGLLAALDYPDRDLEAASIYNQLPRLILLRYTVQPTGVTSIHWSRMT